MSHGIAIELHEARLRRVDRVVPPHGAVFTGMPFGATLAEDDVARDHVFLCGGVSDGIAFVKVVEEGGKDGKKGEDIPPVFLAPRRFPGLFFGPLARPWAAWDA